LRVPQSYLAFWKIEIVIVIKAEAPIPATHPYKQGSIAPTDAIDTSPLNLWAIVIQTMTATANPPQILETMARGPCREEKNVPTSPGRADPVKIPVMFYSVSVIPFMELHLHR